MLDAVATSNGRSRASRSCRTISRVALVELKSNGVVGVAYNVALLGIDHYASTAPLVARSGAQIVIDNCGRRDVDGGVDAPGFRAVLDLARTSRASVVGRVRQACARAASVSRRLAGCSRADRRVRSSDRPYLPAPYWIDYGPLVALAAERVPDPRDRAKIIWETRKRLFGFD